MNGCEANGMKNEEISQVHHSPGKESLSPVSLKGKTDAEVRIETSFLFLHLLD